MLHHGSMPTLPDLVTELLLLTRHSTLTESTHQEGHQLDRSAYILLSRMELDGPMSVRELAEAFGLDISTISRQAAALVRLGLAERRRDDENDTFMRLRPTAEGLRALEADRRRRLAWVSRLVGDWPADESAELLRLVRRFNESVETRYGLDWPRRDN